MPKVEFLESNEVLQQLNAIVTNLKLGVFFSYHAVAEDDVQEAEEKND
jgi:hypothetical protein